MTRFHFPVSLLSVKNTPNRFSAKHTLVWMVALVLLSSSAMLSGCKWGNNSPESGVQMPANHQLAKDETVLFFNRTNKAGEVETVPLLRKLNSAAQKNRLQHTLFLLMRGPSKKEQDMGYYSEIPEKTRLVSLGTTDQEIRISLSKEFESGGGSTAMQGRLAQIEKTIEALHIQTPVYIEIEGKTLQALGGEGLEVEQPINQAHNGEQEPKASEEKPSHT